MTAQQLKNSILQMAVQGKLVPQDPNDEPASVLLERIRTEKEQMIKEGKIKREKNPSVIFRGADNTPYEKVGDTVTPLEVPFEIPESWEWIRPTDIGYFSSGKTPRPDELAKNGIVPYFKVAEMNVPGNELYLHLTENFLIAPERFKLFHRNTIVYPKNGGAVFTNKKRILVKDSLVDLNTGTYTPFSPIDSKFFYYLFSTVDFRKYYKGTALPTVDTDAVQKIVWGLPPLDEQKRIVATIEIVMPFIDKYAVKEKQLALLNTSFPQNLKKSILQMAVQGKLVPQNPSDESAEILLERIRAEKQRLIKEGKIKKDKHESVIFRRDNSHYELVDGIERCIDGEIPFEIPENWAWCRVGSVFSLQAGKNIQTAEIKGILFDGAFLCYGGNGVRGYVDRYNHDGDYPLIGRQGALCGNVNRATGKFYATEHAVCVGTFCGVDVGWACLFLRALNLNQYATATAQPGLAVANINQVYIPVPPLSEQHRIVEKIEELLPLIQSI